tara:strand:+ start:140 stop:994 length:855 start_codon:yes stop_codon:yes gene_type:complete
MKNNKEWIDEIWKNSRYGLCGNIIARHKSNYQEIIVLETRDYGMALMLDGCWMTTDQGEKYYHECLVHPALSSLKNSSKILIIGGGDGGTARECLKYKNVNHIDLVEIDEEVINLSKKYLKNIGGKSWSDERLKINIDDGFQWVKNIQDNYYDAIIVDSSDPSEFANDLFSLKFYLECKRILKKDGIFATQSESPEAFKEIHLKICSSIKKLFKQSSTMYSFVPFYPSGIWSWTFASDTDNNFLELNCKEINNIEKSCDIWNLNFQEGAFKMIPTKIIREISHY